MGAWLQHGGVALGGGRGPNTGAGSRRSQAAAGSCGGSCGRLELLPSEALSLQVMDVINPVLTLASQIYTLVEKVKANKKRSQRLASRVKALENLVSSFSRRERAGSSPDVEQALRELHITLEAAQELLRKYTLSSWVERVLSQGRHVDEFSSVNERLNDAFQVLSGAEQLQQGDLLSEVFQRSCRQTEDKQDRQEDMAELQTRGFLLSSSSCWTRCRRRSLRPSRHHIWISTSLLLSFLVLS